ncbi:MAG: hypothetical protein ACLFS1_11490 [Opitutales bacterium]
MNGDEFVESGNANAGAVSETIVGMTPSSSASIVMAFEGAGWSDQELQDFQVFGSVVPEPSMAAAYLGIAALGLTVLRRRR